MKKFFIVFLIVLILGGIAGGFIYGAVKISSLDTIYPGVSIDGQAVGGLTAKEAAELLNSYGWEKKITTPLTVTTIGSYSFTVTPEEAGSSISAKELADVAYSCGRDENIFKSMLNYAYGFVGLQKMNVTSEGHKADRAVIGALVDKAIQSVEEMLNGEPYSLDEEKGEISFVKGAGGIVIDRDKFIDAVSEAVENYSEELYFAELMKEPAMPDFQALYDTLPHEIRNAEFTDDGRFEVIEELTACEFDVAEAEKAWKDAELGEKIGIALRTIKPEVTGDDLRSRLFCDLLGTCTTYYPNSNDNRRNNLRLATSKIDGLVLYPGDVFSYNEIVGERTEEAGFLPAAAYVNGSEKEEIGGGACQVSSTLYCATLFAFMETVERENHYFPVSYIQLGTDATVTIPTDGGRTIDFKFKNNKTYPIKIVGRTNNEESSITFEIWGTLEDDAYMPIEFDNSYNGQYDCDFFVEKTDPSRPGYIIRLTHETYHFADEIGGGYRTITWRRVIDEEGNIVLEELTNLLNDAGQHTMDTYYLHD